MKLTEDEVQKVLRIIDAMDYREVRLQYGDLRLHVLKAAPGAGIPTDSSPAPESKAGPEAPAPAPVKAAPTPAREVAATTPGPVIRAPLAGVVYFSPKPGAPQYVKVGDVVKPDDTVCLVEVMKLFQSVPAGITGRITKVLAEDGSTVREGDSLFAVDESTV